MIDALLERSFAKQINVSVGKQTDFANLNVILVNHIGMGKINTSK